MGDGARARLLRGANCDHSRSMPARTRVRMRETLGERIRHYTFQEFG
jgi:hypothetical protein